MKFMTRTLYDSMQGDPDDTDALELRWERACKAYNTHLDRIRPKLPPGMKAFADTTLHDSKVLAVGRPSESELMLKVDARRNPWGPIGIFNVRFTGVRRVEGIDKLVGDDWLYEEVHLYRRAGFDYHVLFWRSDFRVVADEVQVKKVRPPSKRKG